MAPNRHDEKPVPADSTGGESESECREEVGGGGEMTRWGWSSCW